jgi:hypothetical protein
MTDGGTTVPVFETPIDAWYVWLGTAAASLAVFGVAMSLPTAPPPDAATAADTVDSIAGVGHNATGVHPIAAEAVQLSPHAVALRGHGGIAREQLSFGPVTPVADGDALARVLAGVPPEQVFADPSEFRRAADRARRSAPGWQSATSLRIRTVVWGDVHVTLVGA